MVRALAAAATVAKDRRATGRLRVRARAFLQAEGGSVEPALIRNVSATGFLAIMDEPLAPGARFAIRLPVGDVLTGQVRWALNGNVGCRLEGRFSRRQLLFLTVFGGGAGLVKFPSFQITLIACAALLLLG